MNGEVAIPDAFLSEMASGHEMSLDEARGNAQKLAKGEGGIDATYTRHNLGTGGGTLDGQGVQTAVSIFKRFGHTAYHRRKQMMAHIKTVSDLQALQSDPKRWMQRKGFTDKDGNWTGG